MRQENFADEMASLERRKRKSDIIKRMSEGAKDPWRASQHGPLREVILTANKQFFADGVAVFDDERSAEDDFRDLAVAWLRQHFGEDCIYAREDVDEEAYHIHAIILPRTLEVMTRTDKKTGEVREIARRHMLLPSKHPMIADYEAAQDSVGAWFSEIGLVRGERRKQAWRDAVAAGEEPREKRRHVKPRVWREREEARLAAERSNLEADRTEVGKLEIAIAARAEVVSQREADVAEREADVEAVITVANAVADGVIEVDTEGVIAAPADRAATPATAAAIGASKQRPKPVQRLLAGLGEAVGRMRGDLASQVEKNVRAEYQDAFTELSAVAGLAQDILDVVEPSLRGKISQKLSDLRAHLSAAGRFASRAIVGLDRRPESQPDAKKIEKRNER
ncbi:hypothetical protein [Donghicola mangrovi]|uniref:Plasmid recombination enzyme n=1 Tax=Donghicola mangrovi TaxID=2729614 RepID=A0A850QI65_9RHOB|nr:hypothetical protein [Donghicola mangrovi]NVO25719.1 hypothetical protein [Donghicola mangrovi]